MDNKSENREFDELFRSAFMKNVEEPDTSVWEKVDQELSLVRSERHLKYVWWFRVAAAILLLISFGTSFIQSTIVSPEDIAKHKPLKLENKEGLFLASGLVENTLVEKKFKLRLMNNSSSNRFFVENNAFEKVNNKGVGATKRLVQSIEIKTKEAPLKLKTYRRDIEVDENDNILALSPEMINKLLNLPQSSFVKNDNELEDEMTSNTSSNWFAGGSISPEVTNAFMQKDQNNFYSYSKGNLSYQSKGGGVYESRVNSAFSTTINVGHKLNESVELITGLTYSDWEGKQFAQYNVQKHLVEYVVVPARNGSEETKIEKVDRLYNLKDTLTTDFKYQSFEVPVMMRYKWKKRKLDYFVSSGFSTSLSSVFKGELNSDVLNASSTFRESTSMEPTRLNLLLGVGIGYRLSNNLLFRLEPNYRYGIHLKDDPFVKRDFSAFGVGTGLNFYF